MAVGVRTQDLRKVYSSSPPLGATGGMLARADAKGGKPPKSQIPALDGLTLGLNWYLNDNFKLQFDYVYDHRYDVPTGTNQGWTRGFGMRMQFMY